jgi:hypothetical protein
MVTPETVAPFVPGAAGLGSSWSPVVERLPPTWRTQLVDLPGPGPVPPRRSESRRSAAHPSLQTKVGTRR